MSTAEIAQSGQCWRQQPGQDVRWRSHVEKLVDEAPPLTPEMRSRLAQLLNAGSTA